mmetsp:Transcript_34053/g.67688  ORF Transcript_34053/g.67688 Transcript_34053/m.67688 type:complete len:485 (+) Transcript_34053:418-1872(+)
MAHHQGQLPLKSEDDGHPAERSKGGMKKIKPRRKKDPNAPKRPLSGYNIFFRDKRCAMKANPVDAEMHMGFEAIVKTVSREWQSMDEEARAKYEALSKVDHTRYLEEMQEYTRKRSLLEVGQDGGGGGGPGSFNTESEEGARKGEKRSRLLGVAKRPLSGYNIFFREEYARIKASMVVDGDDGDSTINMSAEISKRWAGLGVQAKEEVNRKAAQLQADTEAAAFKERREGMGSSSVGLVQCHGSPSPSGIFNNGSGGGKERQQVVKDWPPSAMAQEMYYPGFTAVLNTPAYMPAARDIALQHMPSSSSFSSSSSSFQHDGLSSSSMFSPSSFEPLPLPPPSMATIASDGIGCAPSDSRWLLATQLQQLRQQQQQQQSRRHRQQQQQQQQKPQQSSTQLHMSNLRHQEHYQRQWQQQAVQLLNPLAPTHGGFVDHNRSSIYHQQQQQQALFQLPILQPIALIPLNQISQMQPQQPPQYSTQKGVP